MPVASLRLPATADQVRLARLVAAAAARRCGVPEEVLDEVRLAVGEATARAVLRRQRAGADGHVDVAMRDDLDAFTVEVRDGLPQESADAALPGAGAGPVDELDDAALSLALIEGLPDRVSVSVGPAGEAVTLVWLLPAPDSGAGPAPA